MYESTRESHPRTALAIESMLPRSIVVKLSLPTAPASVDNFVRRVLVAPLDRFGEVVPVGLSREVLVGVGRVAPELIEVLSGVGFRP